MNETPRAENDWNEQIVRIYIDELGYFQGIVVEVTASTVCVDFPVECAPKLKINQHVALAFTASRMGTSLKVPSLVVYMGEDKYRSRIRFEIGDESRIALSSLIEARSEFRVSPDECASIFISADDGESQIEGEIEGVLDNYSSTGISIVTRAEEQSLIEAKGRLRFRMLVPETNQFVTLYGYVRAREDQDAHVRLGIELLTSGSLELMRDHERFERHVRFLQAQILKRLSESRQVG
ncbi:MAG: hypothetical protein GY711_11770 [bacterium]|nr:hypothetical protein [bacterium]